MVKFWFQLCLIQPTAFLELTFFLDEESNKEIKTICLPIVIGTDFFCCTCQTQDPFNKKIGFAPNAIYHALACVWLNVLKRGIRLKSCGLEIIVETVSKISFRSFDSKQRRKSNKVEPQKVSFRFQNLLSCLRRIKPKRWRITSEQNMTAYF